MTYIKNRLMLALAALRARMTPGVDRMIGQLPARLDVAAKLQREAAARAVVSINDSFDRVRQVEAKERGVRVTLSSAAADAEREARRADRVRERIEALLA